MTTMVRTKEIASLGLLAVLCVGAGQTQEKNVDVIPIKYDRLKQEVLKHRGKVLVVDFWSGT